MASFVDGRCLHNSVLVSDDGATQDPCLVPLHCSALQGLRPTAGFVGCGEVCAP